MPFEVMEVAKLYSLLQIGVNYKDALEMPGILSDSLLEFHKEVREYEADQMESQTKSMKNGRY